MGMDRKELLKQLCRMAAETGSLSCLGCGYERSCGIHGCQILKEAAEIISALPDLPPENN